MRSRTSTWEILNAICREHCLIYGVASSPDPLNFVSALARVHISVHVTKTTQTVFAPSSLFTVRTVAGAVSPVCRFYIYNNSVRMLIPHSGQRRSGCRCRFKKPSRKTCNSNECACRKKGWECDPSVCECDNRTFHQSKKRSASVLYEPWSILGTS